MGQNNYDNEENKWKVGKYFKRENIYLGILTYDEEVWFDKLREESPAHLGDCSDEDLRMLIENEIFEDHDYGLFYKYDDHYMRFNYDCDTLIGDNSDGLGTLTNLVPIWDYFNDDEVFETFLNGNPYVQIDSYAPLKKYDKDYNKKTKSR